MQEAQFDPLLLLDNMLEIRNDVQRRGMVGLAFKSVFKLTERALQLARAGLGQIKTPFVRIRSRLGNKIVDRHD